MPKSRRKSATAPTRSKSTRSLHARIAENLEYLGLTRALQTYRDHLAQATKQSLSHLAFLDAVLADEATIRFDRRVKRRISRARFPVLKTLEGFDWNHPRKIDRDRPLSLFDLELVENRRNVLFIGPTGLGKSHLAIALGVAACQRGHSVLFRTAMEIVNELTAAQSDASLHKKLRAFARPHVLVIDELGYLPVDKHAADLLFQVVSTRYERGSIVLTTNRAPADWGAVFNDKTVASAVLDRLSHHSELIVIEGKSYRTQRKSA